MKILNVPAWVQVYLQKRLLIIALLGFSSGVPFYLTSSTLAIWLAESGVSYSAIGLFGFLAFPSSLRFLLAPLIDRVPLPYLTKRFGRRRGWLLLSQSILMIFLVFFAFTNPIRNLMVTGLIAMGVALASSAQDTVMLTYQMESLPKKQYGPGEAIGVLGFRVGMLISGAGALYIAALFSWLAAYLAMAACISIGFITVLMIPEPSVIMDDEVLNKEKNGTCLFTFSS